MERRVDVRVNFASAVIPAQCRPIPAPTNLSEYPKRARSAGWRFDRAGSADALSVIGAKIYGSRVIEAAARGERRATFVKLRSRVRSAPTAR